MTAARVCILLLLPVLLNSQWASVRETTMVFPTYGFDDPNPVARMGNIYPYFRFDGYRLAPVDQGWTVIILENAWIRVLVAPQMGGKILGAFEKKSGKDFIYFNKVVKFREIAMRGPWTSGGIEFNFGAIGHAPTTATPVDYAIDETGPDARCTVGAWDLASRTYWTVEIIVPNDKALFETRSTWTNRSELNTSLYHWMNAAADAREDLVFEYPGTAYIGHDGSVFDFPVAPDGNKINYYRSNARGSNKSFHVLGTYTDYFGARYENSRTGVIHWSPYTDKPGKKIWQWSQAREGAIWTDLLTDPDRGNPQYVEIQNGLLFNQAVATSAATPFKHRFFAPHAVESFSESWFPFNGLGPIVDANATGVLSVEQAAAGRGKREKRWSIGVCAVSPIDDEIVTRVGGNEIDRRNLSLRPMESADFSVSADAGKPIEVSVGNKLLYYSTEDSEARKLSRPMLPNIDFDWESAHGYATIGIEHARQRGYTEAQAAFEQSLSVEPSYTPALVGLAELAYRQMEYDKAIAYASQALANDTYDPAANFVYGLASRRTGRLYDAMDAFGLAASHESHKAASTVELAEIAFIRGRSDELKRAFHRLDLLGPQYASVTRDLRMLSGQPAVLPQPSSAEEGLDQFYLANRYVLDPTEINADAVRHAIRAELPHESYLELAMHYLSLHLYKEASLILDLSPEHPTVSYWKAYLTSYGTDRSRARELLKQAQRKTIDLVFPHRSEDLPMLLWAEKTVPHWKNRYFLALLLWSSGRTAEAEQAFRACETDPDAATFYLARGSFLSSRDPLQTEADYRRAIRLDADQWRSPKMLADHLTQRGRYKEALDVLSSARSLFPDSYILSFAHARLLLFNGRPVESFGELERITLLPFEGARIGRMVWNQAAVLSALRFMHAGEWAKALPYVERAREWPERLGVGRPDMVDERLEDYLEAVCRSELGQSGLADQIFARIAGHTFTGTTHELLSALSLRRSGKDNEAGQRIGRFAKGSETEAGYWAQAVFGKDEHVRAAFETELTRRRANGVWEMIDVDPSFVLVYEVMKDLQ